MQLPSQSSRHSIHKDQSMRVCVRSEICKEEPRVISRDQTLGFRQYPNVYLFFVLLLLRGKDVYHCMRDVCPIVSDHFETFPCPGGLTKQVPRCLICISTGMVITDISKVAVAFCDHCGRIRTLSRVTS